MAKYSVTNSGANEIHQKVYQVKCQEITSEEICIELRFHPSIAVFLISLTTIPMMLCRIVWTVENGQKKN